MAENGGRQLGVFDELSAFLIKTNLYSSHGLTGSHELSMFLELYNANPWTRTTGKRTFTCMCTCVFPSLFITGMNGNTMQCDITGFDDN